MMEYKYGKVWVAGASGRVGTMIRSILDTRYVDLYETDKEDLDITDAEAVTRYGLSYRPNVIINCAGIPDAKFCEENMEEAYKVNALGARNLSAVARKIDARIIQISTDDIFTNCENRAYHEFDTPNPVTVYGKSKFAGENFVKELAPKHLIIRSSWVYGAEGENFVNYVIDKLKAGEKIEAAMDDFACPTSAKELSKVILRLIKYEQEGIYHAVCKGSCSRYELACEVADLAGLDKNLIIPVNRNENKVPRYTLLDDMMLRMCDIERPVTWKEALKEYIEENHLGE